MKTLLSSLTLLSLAVAASAQTVDAFSSFEPNESYDSFFAYVGWNSRNVLSSYMPFTATASGPLTGFRVAMGLNGANSPQPFNLTLWSDANGSVGTSLGVFSGISSDQTVTSPSSDVVTVSASGLTITQGTTYWLQASNPSGAPDRSLGWNLVPASRPNVKRGFTVDGEPLSYSTGRLAAFSVQVAQVQATPEPITLSLGVAAFGVVLKRRRRA